MIEQGFPRYGRYLVGIMAPKNTPEIISDEHQPEIAARSCASVSWNSLVDLDPGLFDDLSPEDNLFIIRRENSSALVDHVEPYPARRWRAAVAADSVISG